jgi:hypothetical protein
MDETATPLSAPPPTLPEPLEAEKLATEYHWPANLGTFDGWDRFASWTAPPEPPARLRKLD